jgi:hypothetical protein
MCWSTYDNAFFELARNEHGDGRTIKEGIKLSLFKPSFLDLQDPGWLGLKV